MGGAGAGDLEVDGWSTTTAAELIDLDRLAELTREAAGRLTEIGCRMSPLAASPDLLASAPLSPVTAAEAEAAIVGATTGPAGALVVAAGLEATGLLVEAAAQTYRRAEQAADGLVSGCQFLAGLAVGLVLTSATEDAALVGGAALLGTAPMWGPALVSSVWALPYAVRAAQGAAALDWSAPMTVLQAFATGHPELVQQFTAGGGGLLSGAELALAPILRERVIGAVGLPISTRDAALVLASQYVDGTPVVTSLPDPTSPPDASAPTPSAPTGIGDLFADLARDVADSGLPGGSPSPRCTRGARGPPARPDTSWPFPAWTASASRDIRAPTPVTTLATCGSSVVCPRHTPVVWRERCHARACRTVPPLRSSATPRAVSPPSSWPAIRPSGATTP